LFIVSLFFISLCFVILCGRLSWLLPAFLTHVNL